MTNKIVWEYIVVESSKTVEFPLDLLATQSPDYLYYDWESDSYGPKTGSDSDYAICPLFDLPPFYAKCKMEDKIEELGWDVKAYKVIQGEKVGYICFRL